MSINRLTEKAIAIIKDDFAFLSGIDELAEMLGVTTCHLIRSFKSATGISPGQYLISIRIDIARLILSNRDYSVDTVANMVGFSGANYFCKVFRRVTGQNPTAYRVLQKSRPGLTDTDAQLLETLDQLVHT